MQAVTNAKEMAEMDRLAIDFYGMPGIALMENAGRGTAAIILEMFSAASGKIAIFCGPGNNGGDGFVIARHLLNAGLEVCTYLVAKPEKISGDARINLDILQKMGHSVQTIAATTDLPAQRPDLVIDALLGTGVRGALRGLFASTVEHINRWDTAVLAVDLPTGIDADSGVAAGPAVRADVTATMALKKRGLLFSPGSDFAGEVVVVDIGMPTSVMEIQSPAVWELDESTIRSLLPHRSRDAHKNRCGTVAVIAGSVGFSGAAILASEAVLRSGAGLVYLCTPQSLNTIFETRLTEVITCPVDDAEQGFLHSSCFPEIRAQVEKQNAVALGPGLGQNAETGELVTQLFFSLSLPMVVDADGLNLAARHLRALIGYAGEMILTPHPGEFSRLIDKPVDEFLPARIDVVRRTAMEWKKTVVLKGGPTVIGAPDGRIFINPTGNPGMATAGSGDVLTGLLAGLLAQGLSAPDAACAGVYIHGLAGDIAAENKSEWGMIAGDILAAIPDSYKRLGGGRW
ncbi:NAD(P)H-hydrate dehydratase [candidate division KSB1 bacterium]|nr:NAD(P)H-hydrate dehydratase [candidate division KSB1 bacterium]